MEMEHLTKQQIVLVTLLVSFVSSIASSIVTVSLLRQAPPVVTETINRVVEKTIERVVAADPTSGGKGTTIKETVVVSEDDAIVKAIDIADNSIVRITSPDSSLPGSFVGFGVIASSNGDIVGRVPAGLSSYGAVLPSGVSVPLSVVHSADDNGIAVLRASSIANSITPVIFADSSNFKLGQKVVVMGGIENDAVSSGIISSLITRGNSKDITSIRTSVGAQVFASDAVLVNLSGEVVGLKIGGDLDAGFLPANNLKLLLR